MSSREGIFYVGRRGQKPQRRLSRLTSLASCALAWASCKRRRDGRMAGEGHLSAAPETPHKDDHGEPKHASQRLPKS